MTDPGAKPCDGVGVRSPDRVAGARVGAVVASSVKSSSSGFDTGRSYWRIANEEEVDRGGVCDVGDGWIAGGPRVPFAKSVGHRGYSGGWQVRRRRGSASISERQVDRDHVRPPDQ